MGWLSAPVSVLRGAWAHTADESNARFCKGPAARDLPRWDTIAFKQALSDCKRESKIPNDTLDQLQAISRVLLAPQKPTPFEVTHLADIADISDGVIVHGSFQYIFCRLEHQHGVRMSLHHRYDLRHPRMPLLIMKTKQLTGHPSSRNQDQSCTLLKLAPPAHHSCQLPSVMVQQEAHLPLHHQHSWIYWLTWQTWR